MASASKQVFVNCPFDPGYKPMFDALVFAITDLGFGPRSSREEDDSGEIRLAKILRIIEECKYGVHDLSAVQLDSVNHLPRFNMPLELGLFLGCKKYGGDAQSQKATLIFDSEEHRHQIFISDLAGNDIHAHNDDIATAIRELRTWFATASKRRGLPGGSDIHERYLRFQADLSAICATARLRPDDVTFTELRQMIADWLNRNR